MKALKILLLCLILIGSAGWFRANGQSGFVLEGADEAVYLGLSGEDELEALPPRLVLEFAYENRFLPLEYPVELIADQTPPRITASQSRTTGPGRGLLTCTTDEYTLMTLSFGTKPNHYTVTRVSNMYEKQHEFLLKPLASYSKLHYIVFATDRSGNQSELLKGSLELGSGVFLPFTTKP